MFPGIVNTHGEAGGIIEIRHVQEKGTIFPQIDQFGENHFFPLFNLGGAGIAVGSQSHQFVLAAVDFESTVIGKGRIEQTKGMGEIKFPQNINPVFLFGHLMLT